jgi:hypothetical protein
LKTGPISRRNALKTILAAAGGLGAAAFLPESWARPVVRTGILPAHAQASSPAVDEISILYDDWETDNMTYGNVLAFRVFAGAKTTGFHPGGHARHAAPLMDSLTPVKGARIVVSLVEHLWSTPTSPASYPLTEDTGADGYANFGDLEFAIGVSCYITLKATCGTVEEKTVNFAVS